MRNVKISGSGALCRQAIHCVTALNSATQAGGVAFDRKGGRLRRLGRARGRILKGRSQPMPLLSHSSSSPLLRDLESLNEGNAGVRFEPIESEPGAGWQVLITLRYGKQLKINGFESSAEAGEWIRTKSAAWLSKYNSGLQA
jgi:hypothetical protein